MTPLAYLRHVFAVTGDTRVPVWPKRWAERADAYWLAEMMGQSGAVARGWAKREKQRSTKEPSMPYGVNAEWMDILRASTRPFISKPLAFDVPSGVDANRYTSRKRDAR